MIRIFKLVLLLVVSQVAFGQAPSNYTNINGRYRWIAGMFDSTFHIPKGTSPSLRTGGSTNAGGLFYNTSDSSVYTYTGTQWIKVRGSINPSDTTNKYVTQVYKKNGSDSVFYVKGGIHTWAFNDSTGSAGGGGGGKVYYFNGGVSMGTFGGFTMYELGDTANTGAAANFTRATTGAIANFITDPNKPGLLQIPAGSWTIDAWLSETGGGANHAEIWIEVEKWDGSTITTIATSPIEQITEGSTPNLYSWSVSIPTTSLTVTDRIIIQFYISNTNGKTVTLYTQNGYVGEVHTTFTTGIGAINGLTAPAQYLVTGTSGTDFNISSVTATHTFNLPTASASNRGALSSTDWTTFNNKVNISDTASMLNPYFRIAGIGLKNTGQTVFADTLLLSTRAWRQKGIDSVAALINNNISGTTNFIPRFSSANVIGNSIMRQSGTSIGINTSPSYTLDILETTSANIGAGTANNKIVITGNDNGGSIATTNTTYINFAPFQVEAMRITSGGVVNMGANFANNFNKLNVGGSATIGYTTNVVGPTDGLSVNGSVGIGLNGASTDSALSVLNGVRFQRGVRMSGLPSAVGTKSLRIDASGTVSVADTLANPISGTGTTNYVTKWTSSSAVGNSQIFDNGTNVGIGTNTPTRTLDVNGIITTNNNLELTSPNPTILWTTSNLRFYNNTNGVVATISSAGQLSLSSIPNATTDTDKFLVSDGGVVKYRTGSEVLSDIGGASSSSISGTTNYIPKFTSSSAIGNSLIFDNGTNVGIGTNNPTAGRLQINVNDITTAAHFQIVDATTTLANSFVTNFRNANDGNGRYSLSSWQAQNAVGNDQIGFIGVQSVTGGANYTPNLIFGQKTGASSYTTRMTLDASGNLGLGTSSPAVLLEANGVIRSTRSGVATQYLQIDGGNAGAVYLTAGGAGKALVIQNNNTTSSNIQFDQAVASQYLFNQAGTTKLTLDASGNLGLGVTPSAWDATLSKAIQLNGGSLWGYSTSQINLLQNAFYNTSGDIAYVNSASASAYRQISGVHSWHTAPSGTAGNAISFTQAMTLDASGRLAVGTSSPSTLRVTIENNGGNLRLRNTTTRYRADFVMNTTELGINSYDDVAASYMPIVIEGSKISLMQGNVGIGTTNPVSKLQVEGETRILYSKAVAANPLDVSSFSGLITVNTNNINGSLSGLAMYANSDYNAAAGIFASRTSGTSADLVFYAGSATAAERMRITSGGDVGIGTSSPVGKLDVSLLDTRRFIVTYDDAIITIKGASNTGAGENLRIIGDKLIFNTGSVGSGTERMRITSGGEVYIGNNPADQGAYNLQVNGTGVWGAGAYVDGSDSAVKKNIQPLGSSLDLIKQMNPVTFEYQPFYSKDTTTQTGFIAQELQQVLSDKVYKNGIVKEGGQYLGVAYQHLIPLLVKAIQEQQTQIDQLKAQLNNR